MEQASRILKYASSSFEPLSQNKKHQFAAAHALNIYNSNAIYSFIPKNACTTMRFSLALGNECIDSKDDFNWIHRNNATFSASLRELQEAAYTFVILRSPIYRLASVYLDKIVDRTNVAWNLYDLIKREIPLAEITFRKFVELVTSEELIHKEIHWAPQSDFLVYKYYDDYFSLEQFSEAIPLIEKRAGIKIYDARNLTKHGTDQYTMINDQCYADTKPYILFNLKLSGKIPSHESLYDITLKNMVEEAYKNDFILYRKYSEG